MINHTINIFAYAIDLKLIWKILFYKNSIGFPRIYNYIAKILMLRALHFNIEGLIYL